MEQAVTDLIAGDAEACARLLGLLAGLSGAEGRAALGVLARAPGALITVDRQARHSTTSVAVLQAMAAKEHDVVAVALASLHADGHVREHAVRAMQARPDPLFAPFLVLRAVDWVRQVRDPARYAVATLLAEDSALHLSLMLPIGVRVNARARSRFVMNQLVAAVLAAPPSTRLMLAGGGSTAQRRLIFDLDRAQGRLRLGALVELAESDPDPRIRAQAAESACREAVWTEQITVLRRLSRGSRTEARVTALAGLLRLGLYTDVIEHLDDRSALVRAVAREGARRAGVDAVAHYRDAAPTPGSIAGFAETMSPSDVARLFPLLGHADRAIRAEAVRGVRRLGGVTPDLIGPLLRDPAPAVVREAAAALRPIAARLPERLPWDLLAEPRPELRRAGYRLLNGRTPLIRLRAALTLTLDDDPDLARRARADTTHLARAATAPVRRRIAGDLTPTAEERACLEALVQEAADRLGEHTTALLHEWLN